MPALMHHIQLLPRASNSQALKRIAIMRRQRVNRYQAIIQGYIWAHEHTLLDRSRSAQSSTTL